jgi:hypothetical protein
MSARTAGSGSLRISDRILAELRALERSATDVRLGAHLLRGTPTNESRTEPMLVQVSRRAQEHGRAIAADPGSAKPGPSTVVEHDDGLLSPSPAIARVHPRLGRIDLYTDVIAHCEAVIAALGWRGLFPEGSIREAALLHERAHELIVHGRGRELRRATAVPALRLGRHVRWAHIAGADELAAHAFAQARLGLPRSPMLAALAADGALRGSVPTIRPSLEEE